MSKSGKSSKSGKNDSQEAMRDYCLRVKKIGEEYAAFFKNGLEDKTREDFVAFEKAFEKRHTALLNEGEQYPLHALNAIWDEYKDEYIENFKNFTENIQPKTLQLLRRWAQEENAKNVKEKG